MSKRTKSSGKSAAKSQSSAKKQTKSPKVQPKAQTLRSPVERRSRSVVQNSPGQDDASSTEVAFAKGTYVAFVDPSDNLEKFKIALMLSDMRDVDEEVVVDIYEEIAPLSFKRVSNKQHLQEYQIISDVAAATDKTAKRGAVQVKITRQQQNKVEKLMPAVVEKIEAQESNDEEDESESSSEQSDSEDERETVEQIRGRRMIKAQPIKEPAKQVPAKDTRSKSKVPQTQEAPKSKKISMPPPKKSKQIKPPSKKRGKAQSDEDDEEEKKSLPDQEMEDEEKSEEEMIVTSSKSSKKAPAKAPAKLKSKALSQVLSKVGKKRVRTNKDEDEDEEEEGSNLPRSEEDEESMVVKKRKVSSGKSQVVKVKKETKPKAKKAPKRPTTFKKGRWNPDIELLDVEKYKTGPENKLYFDCCIRCNNKNIIRAVLTGNKALLKDGIAAKRKISLLNAYWSPDVKTTAMEYVASRNDHEMMELLLHPKIAHIPLHSTYDQMRNQWYQDRIHNPTYLLHHIDTGNVSKMAYGARVRKVQMTRGNRQGNNAFLQYEDMANSHLVQYTGNEKFLRTLIYDSNVTVDTFKILIKLNQQVENALNAQVYDAVRAGNRELAHELVKNLIKHENWGFNELHMNVLGTNKNLPKVLKVSTSKKCNTNKDITPMHCACINPDDSILKQLIDVNPDFSLVDSDLRRPIHYAAACITPAPLKLLLSKGASLIDQDNQKNTCLHVAAWTGRHENVRAILEVAPQLLGQKNKKSMNAMAYACKYGHTKVVEVLFQFGGKPNMGCGLERMTPLCWAAAHGHYELSEWLVDNKGRVLGKDKFKRTPLILAVRNGHSKIAQLMLQRGSEFNHCDSSMNTALHYAAAYGWLECIDQLISAGADINAANSWKITPINIAMMMNHRGCVRRLLREPNVDVNGKDEKGRTLLHLAMIAFDSESLEFVRYLLEKGANPNIQDLEGQAPLHYLAKYNINTYLDHTSQQTKDLTYKEQVEYQKAICTLLIEKDGDLTMKDGSEQTPFAICLNADNAPLLEFLQEKVSFNKEPELFFDFVGKIFDEQYQKILVKIIKNDPPMRENINSLDGEGLTPFLRYIQQFTLDYNNLLTQIQYRVNAQSFLHGANQQNYNITNKDIFNKFADQQHYYNYNYNLTEQQKQAIALEIFENTIFKPFQKLLDFLIESGADSQAKVQKKKLYRDLEIQNKAQFAQMTDAVKDLQKKQMEEEKEKVKKRDEAIRERNNKKMMAGKYGRGKRGRAMYAKPAAQAVASFFSSNAQVATGVVYDTRNGEKVLREYGQNGLQNAAHITMKLPYPNLLNYLIDLGVDVDEPDYDGVTPFNFLSKRNGEVYFHETYNKFLSLDVRIDYPDIKGRTPFLNYYEFSNFDCSNKMLELGANVNQMDTSGLFALKYALLRRQNNEIEDLIGKGANINQIDNRGRNLLHHAVNMSSATADATFETEEFLIKKGVEINLQDDRLRTPIHYAFVKIGRWNDNSQIDPIETVSSLCGYASLKIDLQDKWLKTPLHYAAQRGASICSIYLIKRGADLETKDIYGNTPLGIGLLRQHYNYGIILMQKDFSGQVNTLVYNEYPQKIQAIWDEEEKQKKLIEKYGDKANIPQDVDMVDDESKQEGASKKKKKHRDLFNPNKNVMLGDYGDEDDEDEYGEESDEDQLHHENVFNQQNAFGMSVYNTNPFMSQSAAPKSMFGGKVGGGVFGVNMLGQPVKTMAQPAFNLGNPQQQMMLQNQLDQGYLPKEDEGVSLFKLAIRGGQQGLAYLMMELGYPLMLCIQDAMDEKKFLLVITLLAKTPDNATIQITNSKNQNLFHILAMNCSGCNEVHLRRIYDTLKERGVDSTAKDIFNRTALHYAVKSGSITLVNLILQQENRSQVNEIDIDGHTPLTIGYQGVNSKVPFYNRMYPISNIFLALVKAGADVNFVYPEKSFRPSFTEEEVEDVSYDPKGFYKTTLLINVLRQQPDIAILEQNLIGLIEFGAKLSFTDSDGRDAVMYAIMQNDIKTLRLFLDNKASTYVNKNGQDKAGKSACHYVVNPVKFGSYENKDILELLSVHKFDLKLKDIHGKIPLAYASEQESGKMFKILQRLTNSNGDVGRLQRAVSMIRSDEWPRLKVDFEQDSETFMNVALEKEVEVHEEKKIPVDATGNFEKSYKVYYDENNVPWDCYLNKVDLKNGLYGDYVFYKMQLLYDSNRDLYVVFTRWGRIGETGMNQRTPFNNIEEAKKEYKNIFKQKTGGNNFEELDNFERHKKKYNLAKVSYVTTNYKEYLQPFDFEKCPKSKLSTNLYDLFEEVSNVTMYQRAMNDFGINQSVMPFSAVSKDTIVKARLTLMEIGETVKDITELQKQGIKADYDQMQALREKIAELSSRYYECIPQTQYANQIAPPLSNVHQIKVQFDNLESLTNIEFASKMLLGALYKQNEMNPVDYVYNALNIMIDPLEKQGAEFDVINQYIENTKTNNQNYNMWGHQQKTEVAGIYKIQRKGEAETISAYKEVPNHFLLFHGSQMFNFIGILSQGLRIAPPEAPPTGYMFGKGVYFADMFEKSIAYSNAGYQQQDSMLMIMCEVVVGKSKELYQANFVENLEPQYQSVKGVGRRGPSYENTLVLPNGVKVPFGKTIDYYAGEQYNHVHLQHNEYIVYNTSQIRMRYLVHVKKDNKQ